MLEPRVRRMSICVGGLTFLIRCTVSIQMLAELADLLIGPFHAPRENLVVCWRLLFKLGANSSAKHIKHLVGHPLDFGSDCASKFLYQSLLLLVDHKFIQVGLLDVFLLDHLLRCFAC